MKRFILFPILIMCIQVNSLAQKPEKKQNSPKEDIRVSREYDENGNLIKFDSVYTYSWSGDTTLMESLPEDFPFNFDQHFGFSPDSTYFGHSFFDDFDQLFSQPFLGKRDSLMMKKFDLNHHFRNFGMNPDSLAMKLKDFEEYYKNFNENNSISPKIPLQSRHFSQPKSMDDMMKMLQQHMQKMEEYQRNLFKENPKWQEF